MTNVVYALFVESAERADNAFLTGMVARGAKDLPNQVIRGAIDDWLTRPVGFDAAAEEALMRWLGAST